MRLLKIIFILWGGLIRKLIQKKNWYWPNLIPLLRKRIVITGNIPLCDQCTIISGDGKFIFGKNCKFGIRQGGRHRNGSIEFNARNKDAQIVVQENVFTNNNLFICAENFVEIGNGTLIGEGVTITDHEAHNNDPGFRDQLGQIGIVKIGNNVWIGNRAIILKNTIIGNNSIIAAGSVVSGTFPSDVIVGGVPAKVLRAL
jgi:acetyltransferase-like isoleucine patch superfamily enzyme